MFFGFKSILQLIVPEYSITGITFIAILFILSKQTDLLTFVLFPFIVYLLTLFAFNTLNQVFDAKIDAISKPYRPIPSGKISKKIVALFAISLYALALFLAFISNLLFLEILFIIITVLYSIHWLGLRKSIISSPIFGIIFYVLVPFLFVSSYFNLKINYFALIFFSLIIASISFLKDIEDLKGDQKAGFKTIPIIFGVKKTLKISFYSLISVLIFFGIILTLTINFFFVIPTMLSIILTIILWLLIKRKKLFFINSKKLFLFIILIIIIQLLYSLFFINLNNGFDINFSHKILFLIFSYFFMPAGVKYVDEAFDSKTFNKKIATVITPLLIILGLFTLTIDSITAVFISGYIIGVLLTKKVDLKEHILFAGGWLIAILFLGVYTSLINNLFLLIIFSFLTILDEKGNNYVDNYLKNNKKKLSLSMFFLRARGLVLIGTIILVLFGFIPNLYILLVLIWLLGYNLPIIISEKRNKLI
jgi:geranylgeranylglycerol-phosphate geranylgeranyltransferase